MNPDATAEPETKADAFPRRSFIVLLALSSVFLFLFWRYDWLAFLCYLFVGGGCQLVVMLLASAVFYSFLPSGTKLVWSIQGFFLFNFWLLWFGLIGDFAWLWFAENKLCINHDPFVEWLPFVIPGDWTIDVVFHGSLTQGTTWGRMYLVWFLIALPVWGLTAAAYHWTKPLLPRKSVPDWVRNTVGVFGLLTVILVWAWLVF